eukprot:gene14558-17204_t
MEHFAWFHDRIGTYFVFTEWIFIGCYWAQILFSFFLSTPALSNSKKVWVTARVCAATFGVYNIVTVTLGMIDKNYIIKWYLYGTILFYVLYGFSILFNGIVLVRFIRSAENSGISGREKSIAKITGLAIMLAIMFAQSYVVMTALADTSIRNYFRFGSVNEENMSESSNSCDGHSKDDHDTSLNSIELSTTTDTNQTSGV